MIMCNQSGCTEAAAFRFTWLGRPEAFICVDHVLKLGQTAKAMGMPLQIIPLTLDDHMRHHQQSAEGAKP